ncbi:MAG TPA: glycosyltransferase [Methylomirabilota bacterium]|nr:glycosyltransferase [Methylomirabilota bacterium]
MIDAAGQQAAVAGGEQPGASPRQQRPRVALLTRGIAGGGVQVVMLNIARGLAARDFDVTLLYRARRKEPPPPAGTKAKVLAGYPRFIGRIMAWRADPSAFPVLARPVLFSLIAPEPLRLLPSLVRYLRSERPAVLISATTYMNLVAIWARDLAGVPTRVVVSEHDHLSQHISTGRDRGAWRWRYAPALLARVYPKADAIVAVSDGVADDLAARTGIDRARIRTVYNPIVTSDLDARAAADPAEPWLEPGMPPVILAAGRLVPKKDFATLLQAFVRVRQTTDARLIILGEGREKRRLQALAHSLGIAVDLKFAGWTENPYAYMARAAVFALSSIREGFGNVLVEALACGCPVVATDCLSGPAEILDGGRYGRLVAPGDVDAFAAALLGTLAARPDPEPLRQRAQMFTVRRTTDAYVDLLEPGVGRAG